ncbi:MAG: hypothetical protein ACKPA7_00290 [Sphaerospermopsis kisseleviana]
MTTKNIAIYRILTNLANAGLTKHEFKSALQLVGRCRPYHDSEFLAAAVAGDLEKDDFQSKQIVKDNMKELIDLYSRPDYISKDYKILLSAYPDH